MSRSRTRARSGQKLQPYWNLADILRIMHSKRAHKSISNRREERDDKKGISVHERKKDGARLSL